MARRFTVQEAAVMLGYNPDHLRRLLRAGTVKGERFSRVWMVDRTEVESIKGLQGRGGRMPKSGPVQPKS